VTQLSEHFALEEMTVSAGHPELVEPIPHHLMPNVERLATEILEPIRRLWHPMRVLSCYRPDKLNRAVGGSPTSQHREAGAADIQTQNERGLFMSMIQRPNKFPTGQVIGYPRQHFVHIALPSKRYPTPTFFVCIAPKVYQQVNNAAEANRFWEIK
jgi:zinc D-Ala-D-Ala carboxypeptidase